MTDLKLAVSHLRDCFSKSYDDESFDCVTNPSHRAVAAWMVLTDYRVWIFPEEDDTDDLEVIELDVVKRRLMPDVRADQCSKKERPGGKREEYDEL